MALDTNVFVSALRSGADASRADALFIKRCSP